MIEKANEIAQLLLRKRNNTISEQQIEELNRHLQEDNSIQMLAENLEDEAYVHKTFKEYCNINIPDVGLIKNSNKDVSKKVKPIHWFRKYKYAAASILVFISSALLYYYNFSDLNIPNASHANEVIAPGSNKARLRLSDGSTFELNDDKAGVQVEQNAIKYANGNSILDNAKSNLTATLDVPRGGQYNIQLADGTQVWLNAQSKLHYPLQFTQSTRTVTLEGEAYFEVAHNPKQPFVVKFQNNEINVLGTVFNVQAYSSNGNNTQTTLLSGRISLKTNSEQVILSANEQAVINNSTINVKNVDAERYALWKEGVIVLDKQNIQQIIPQLERWYDVEFEIAGLPMHTQTLSGEIPRDIPLIAVLDVIMDQLKLKFEIRGRRVMLKN